MTSRINRHRRRRARARAERVRSLEIWRRWFEANLKREDDRDLVDALIAERRALG